MSANIRMKAEEKPETWIVTPTPGYVLKFKEVHHIGRSKKIKGFINVCHCTQLPPPTDDLDDEQLAAQIDKGDYNYRVPICVGEVDAVDDKGGQPAMKIDVLVNSTFFEKRLAPADANFFRHFLSMVMAEAIQSKHDVVINPNDAIKLNRKKIGDIGPITMCKRPPVPVVHEISSQGDDKTSKLDFQESLITSVQPKNVIIRLLGGEKVEIKLDLEDVEPAIKSANRLKLKLTPDRILVLLDNQRSLFDFCIPFNIDSTAARSKLIVEKKALVISAPIVFG